MCHSKIPIFLLTTLTVCEILGLVQAIAYIKLPIILVSETSDICFTSLVCGDNQVNNLKYAIKEVSTSLDLSTPKHSSMLSTYFFEASTIDMHTYLYRSPSPKIFFDTHKSFISNSPH